VIGHRERAMRVYEFAAQVESATRTRPIIINEHYMKASLLAYYMPGRPKVYCGGSYMGHRPNAYDYFAATDLTGVATLRPTPPPPPPPRQRNVLAPVEEPRGPLYALLASLTVAVAALATYVIVRPAPAVVVQAPAKAAAPSVLAADDRADEAAPAAGGAAVTIRARSTD